MNPSIHRQANPFLGLSPVSTRLNSSLGCSTSFADAAASFITRRRARPANLQGRGCSSSAVPPSRDLLRLRGVGPVNANLLLAKQIISVEMLQEIYHTTCNRDKQELQRYLSVRERHCSSYFRQQAIISILMIINLLTLLFLFYCRRW